MKTLFKTAFAAIALASIASSASAHIAEIEPAENIRDGFRAEVSVLNPNCRVAPLGLYCGYRDVVMDAILDMTNRVYQEGISMPGEPAVHDILQQKKNRMPKHMK